MLERHDDPRSCRWALSWYLRKENDTQEEKGNKATRQRINEYFCRSGPNSKLQCPPIEPQQYQAADQEKPRPLHPSSLPSGRFSLAKRAFGEVERFRMALPGWCCCIIRLKP